jgi:hypothetical protein
MRSVLPRFGTACAAPIGRTARRRSKSREAFLQVDTVKTEPELISPDNWNMDLHYLDRPMRGVVNLTSLRLPRLRLPRQRRTLSEVAGVPQGAATEDGRFLGLTCSSPARAKNPISRSSRNQDAPIELRSLRRRRFARLHRRKDQGRFTKMSERPVRAVCEGRHYEDDCDEAKVTSRQNRDERRAGAEANQEQSSLGQISETGPRRQRARKGAFVDQNAPGNTAL